MLQIYNTLSRQKESFEPLNPPQVKMYVCGPTVYDSAHIGHAMSYIIFDMVRRYLEYRGYHVRLVQNFTDVEDKIIMRSQALDISWQQLTDGYIQEFLKEMDGLNIKRAHVYPYASQEIPEIIRLIEGLIEKEYAYVVEGDVYFRVNNVEDYGKLSRRALVDMQPGARVSLSEIKEYPMDFALWKASKLGEPSWESPWGSGRPGWHIECSAMSIRYLGDSIDIHGGGADLIFPHHENEIAQSESFTGCTPFVKYWLHNGLLQLGDEKMSKSTGNLITIKELIANHDPNALRFFVLSSHYRRPATYTEASFAAAERGLSRLYAALRPLHNGVSPSSLDGDNELKEKAEATRQKFEESMDDDFNTAIALSALFELAKAINTAIDKNIVGPGFVEAQATLQELLRILGFNLNQHINQSQLESNNVAPFIELLLSIRSELRDEKQWAFADRIRDGLTELGIVLEDTAQGTKWRL
jgi:cysteinyl-tRNA synthetase